MREREREKKLRNLQRREIGFQKFPPKTYVFILSLFFFSHFPTFYFSFTLAFRYRNLDGPNCLGFPRRVQGRPIPRCTGFHYLMILHQIVTRYELCEDIERERERERERMRDN